MRRQLKIPLSFQWPKTLLLALFLLGAALFSRIDGLAVGSTGRPPLPIYIVQPSVGGDGLNKEPFANSNLVNLVPTDLADYIEAIAVDDSGAIYVVGKTSAPDFPLVNPFQSTYGGGESDGFITVFASDGQSLLSSTYLGGNGMDVIKDIAISETGHIFLTGTTTSTNFPLTNPYQPSLAGFEDGFVTVFEPDLQMMSFSTYIGGEDGDYPHSIITDSGGITHFTGYTYSTNFPLLNPVQSYQGGKEVFVTGFSPDGQSLVYSTYLGGSDDEESYEIVVDSIGRKYITGYTESIDFPTANAYQPIYGGFRDGFVTVLSADSQSFDMSTFLGGSFFDRAYSIQLDSNDHIYVGGETESGDFPLVNPYQPVKNEGWDGFVSIFNADGESLIYSTFLGGNQSDTIQSITLDNLGHILAVGYTYSTDFPLFNPLQPNNNGFTDVFVTSFEQDGQSLFFSTYLGGEEGDVGYSMSLDNDGLVNIGGVTWSHNFPVMNPYQTDITGYVDGFVSILNADGQSLQYSTYLGGSYPSPTDVSLDDLGSRAAVDADIVPSWVWLTLGLVSFFLASVFFGRMVGLRKKWSRTK